MKQFRFSFLLLFVLLYSNSSFLSFLCSLICLHFFFFPQSTVLTPLVNWYRIMFQQNGTIAWCIFPDVNSDFQLVNKMNVTRSFGGENRGKKRVLKLGDMSSSSGPSSIYQLWIGQANHFICLGLISKIGSNSLIAQDQGHLGSISLRDTVKRQHTAKRS